MADVPNKFTVEWRLVRAGLWTALGAYAFAVGQLHWQPFDWLKPWMDFITIGAVGVILWKFFSTKR